MTLKDDDQGLSFHWAIPLNEPQQPKVDAPVMGAESNIESSPDVIRAAESFLLLGEDPPSDEVFRPRLGRYEDAA